MDLDYSQFGYCPYLQGIGLNRAMGQRCAAHFQGSRRTKPARTTNCGNRHADTIYRANGRTTAAKVPS